MNHRGLLASVSRAAGGMQRQCASMHSQHDHNLAQPVPPGVPGVGGTVPGVGGTVPGVGGTVGQCAEARLLPGVLLGWLTGTAPVVEDCRLALRMTSS